MRASFVLVHDLIIDFKTADRRLLKKSVTNRRLIPC